MAVKKKAKRRRVKRVKKVARRRPAGKAKAKKSSRRKRPAKRKKVSRAKGLHPVKYIERTERVMAGKKKKKCHCRHRVYMAGSRRTGRRRSVGKGGGNMGLLLGLALGGVAVYMLTKKPTTTQYPAGYTSLPPVQQTQNYTRNTQSSDIVNYAIAAGYAISAISSLIDRLNSSSDQEVSNIYDNINTTGDVGAWV